MNHVKINQKMTLKIIKILLFVGITTVMILPFGAMGMADAVSSMTLQTDKITIKEQILQIEQNVNAIKHEKLDTEKIILKTSKQIHNLQDVTLASLVMTYKDALKNVNIQEVKELTRQIDTITRKIITLESQNSQNTLALERFDDTLVDKWNNKAELVSRDFAQKFNEKHTSDAEFARAENSIKAVFDSDSISKAQWSVFFDDLNIILEKLDYDLVSEEDKAELKQLVAYEIQENTQTTQISQYLNSQFPSIHFLSASSTSCGSPSDYMPYHYQPTSDIDAGNGLKKTYAKMYDGTIYGKSLSGKCIIEVTHVYYDEDHPSIDSAYDVIRQIYWGRISDIETYFLVVDKSSTATLNRISFQKVKIIEDRIWPLPDWSRTLDGAYSSTNTWITDTHHTGKVTSITFEIGKHPKLYVNTWNHLFGEDDNNASKSDTKTNTSTYSSGSRITAEESETSRDYKNEKLVVAP